MKGRRIKEEFWNEPNEWAAVVLELKNRPSPKSPSFTIPSAVMNTFAGFMSEIDIGHIQKLLLMVTR